MTFNEMFYSLSVLCVLNMGEHPNKNQNKTKKQLNIWHIHVYAAWILQT